MLTGGASGNCYTYEEIKDALVQAGFAQVNLVQPGTQMDGLVEAFRRHGSESQKVRLTL
jgi:hypothetical protein